MRHDLAALAGSTIALAGLLCSAGAVAQTTATAHRSDAPALPRVLIIGDSISLGYTQPVTRLLAGKADVHRVPDNCQSTVYGLAHIRQWLGSGHWDVIHFNWGIWDIHHLDGERIALGGRIRTTPEQYRKNLQMLLGLMKPSGARLIWASTTPVRQPSDPTLPLNAVDAEDIPIYNRVAAQVMRDNGLPVDNLYKHILPFVDKYWQPDHIHYTAEGSAFLAERVAKSIESEIHAVQTNSGETACK